MLKMRGLLRARVTASLAEDARVIDRDLDRRNFMETERGIATAPAATSRALGEGGFRNEPRCNLSKPISSCTGVIIP